MKLRLRPFHFIPGVGGNMNEGKGMDGGGRRTWSEIPGEAAGEGVLLPLFKELLRVTGVA